MPGFKVSYFFQDTSGYGWSENYWAVTSLPAVIQPIAVRLGDFRVGILPQDVGLNYIRIASSIARNPQLVTYSNNPGAPNGLYPMNSDPDFAALKVRLEASVGNSHTFLRTLPTDCVTEDGYTPTPAFLNAFNNWASYLAALHPGNVQFSLRSSLQTPPPPRIPINTPTPNLPRGFTFLCATGSFSVGQQIRVRGCKVYGYNGLKTVVAVTVGAPNDTVLVGGAAPPTSEPLTSQPSANLETFQFNAIGGVFPLGLTRRAPGRFFGQRRGRRQTINPLRQ